MFIGLFLIIIGTIWVLSNTGVIAASISQFFWPAILIAIGCQIIFDQSKKKKDCCCTKEEKKAKE